MLVKLVSFYTPGAYALEAEELSRSAADCMMPLETYERGPFDSWGSAVAYKPEFLRERLETLGDQFAGLLWLDSDARYRREPDWSILKGADLAFTKFRWSPGHQWENLSGTVYLSRTPKMVDFCREWSHVTQGYKHTDTPEQRGLAEVLARPEWSTLRVVDLPIEWTFVSPEFFGMYPGRKPYFEHLQASRRLRK